MRNSVLRTDDFNFALPEELIAQLPAPQRQGSRLLQLNGKTGGLIDSLFTQLPDLLHPDDLLIFNDTRVIKARLMGKKASGGSIEVLVERILSDTHALAHIRASKSPKPGTTLIFAEGTTAKMVERQEELFLLAFQGGCSVSDVLDRYGQLPLPPYIQHSPDAEDEVRYQTVFAREPGAVAAPTAGLHFDEQMLETLKQKGIRTAHVTLHVGAGTFQPVRVENIADHRMHCERYDVPESTVEAILETWQRHGRVTAIGTTALRALESAAQSGTLKAGKGETSIFITPGYEFKVVQRLLTNFHLPKSTLLMLVSAFAGIDSIKNAYQHAIEQRYRFFSYGDAMLIDRKQP